ncbi:MAG: ATP-dependent DNA helicase, partial [Actinomycetota bacterium]|nr:ATP-dependent DNA helicase [Actinomycetota bacterium]
AAVLDQCLWGERTVVLTSATIPANLSTRLGLTDHQHRIEDVGSPFDFERQSLLYCATSMPDPSDDGYRVA